MTGCGSGRSGAGPGLRPGPGVSQVEILKTRETGGLRWELLRTPPPRAAWGSAVPAPSRGGESESCRHAGHVDSQPPPSTCKVGTQVTRTLTIEAPGTQVTVQRPLKLAPLRKSLSKDPHAEAAHRPAPHPPGPRSECPHASATLPLLGDTGYPRGWPSRMACLWPVGASWYPLQGRADRTRGGGLTSHQTDCPGTSARLSSAAPAGPSVKGVQQRPLEPLRKILFFLSQKNKQGFMAAPASGYASIPGWSTTSIWPGNGYIFPQERTVNIKFSSVLHSSQGHGEDAAVLGAPPPRPTLQPLTGAHTPCSPHRLSRCS